MLNELAANIRELIERSLANTEQSWMYYVRIRVEDNDQQTAETVRIEGANEKEKFEDEW